MSATERRTTQLDAQHPWPGLMPFTEETQAFFHGRDRETAELARLIRRETLTVLFGQSGLGKSSLLNAGLFPLLRAEDFLPVYLRLDFGREAAPFRAQVLAAIAANCATHRVEAPAPREDEPLWAYFHRVDADFWSVRNRLLTPVLIFDQTEELFTLGRHDDETQARCRALLEELADLIENRMPAAIASRIEARAELGRDFDYARLGYKVVLSFREDYLPEFEGLRPLIRSIMQNRMRLTRMSGEQAHDAILRSGGHLMSPEVAGQIVRFVAAPRAGRAAAELAQLEVEPALLSVVCRELNNHRLKASQAQISAELLGEGAQQQIIQDFYDGSLQDLEPAVRIFVEDNLLTDAGYRDSYALEDALALPGVTQRAIDTLIERRLLRLEERSDVLRVELTHDVLTGVARASRDQRKARQAEEERRRVEAQRRAQSRRLLLFSGTTVAVMAAVAVVFAILLQQAKDERRRLIETQSYVWLARANAAAEQGIPGEPYAMVAEALRLDARNRAALLRAGALLEQRRHAAQLTQLAVSGLARVAWFDAEQYAVFSPGLTAWRRLADADTARPLTLQAADDDYADAGALALQPGPAQPLAQLTFFGAPRLVATAPGQPPQPAAHGLFAYHPEARVVSYVSRNAMLHLLEPPQGGRVGQPVQLTGTPREVTVSPGRHWLAAQMESGELVLARLDGQGWQRAPAALAPTEGERALVAVTDAGVTLRRTATGLQILVPRDGAAPRIVSVASTGPAAASTDGRVLAVAEAGGVQLYDAATAAPLSKRLSHPAAVRDLAFSADGRLLALAAVDKMARVWDLERSEFVGPGLRHQGAVLVVRFLPAGEALATGAADGTIRVWQARTGRPLGEALMHPDPIADLAISPDGAALAAMTFGEELFVWKWSADGALPLPGATAVAATRDGRRLAVSDGRGTRVLARGDDGAFAAPQAIDAVAADALVFAPDGTQLAIGRRGGGLALAGPDGDVVVLNPDVAVELLTFSGSGRRLASVDRQHVVRITDTQTRAPAGAALAHEGPLASLEFSPDETLLMTAEQSRIRLWRIETGALAGELALPPGERLVLAAFDAGGAQLLAVLGGHIARIPLARDAAGRLQLTAAFAALDKLPLGDLKVWSAALAPSRARLAIGGVDGRVRVVDLAGWRFAGETMKHDDAVLGLDFAGDESRLLTWSRDRTVRVWDAASAHPVSDTIDAGGEPLTARLLDGGGVLLRTADAASLQPVGRAADAHAPSWLPAFLEAVGASSIDSQGGIERMRDRLQRLADVAPQADSGAAADWRRRLEQAAAPRGAAVAEAAP